MRAERVALRIASTPAFSMLVSLLERLARWDPDYLPVLTYHRIDDPAASPDLYPGLISATPRSFQHQMAHLSRRMRPVSIGDVLRSIHGARLPRRAVLVTFDDATEDFRRNAWPVLQRHGVPATLFVPTAYPGDPALRFWWDDLYAALRTTRRPSVNDPTGQPVELATTTDRAAAFRHLLGHLKSMEHGPAMVAHARILAELEFVPVAHKTVLDWDELRSLAGPLITLAAHSRAHPLLTRVPATEALAEAAGSRADLEAAVGPVPPVFAYPSGAWDASVAEVVADAGFALAFTTDRGVNHLPTAPPLALKRINVGGRASLPVLRAQLLPALHRLPGWVRRGA